MEENASKIRVGAEPPSPLTGDGSGSALFVINLCASIAPVQTGGKNLPGLENYRLYQVARVEDGRTRHRLRLGFFTSEAHAESVLAVVRQQYPTAFTACLCDEDRRFTRGYLPGAAPAPARPVAVVTTPAQPAAKAVPVARAKAPPAPPPAARPAPKASIAAPAPRPPEPKKPAAVQTPPAKAIPAKTLPAKAKAPPAAPARPEPARVAASSSMRTRALDLSLSDPPPPVVQKPSVRSNQPFHVGKGVEIGDLQISLQPDVSSAGSTPKAAPAHALKSAPLTSSPLKSNERGAGPGSARPAPPAPARTPPPGKPAAAMRSASSPGSRAPDLDSTQTIRALTSAELSDEAQEKWFAIQLAASEQPVNLDTMPHLDIFEAYRLYSVAIAGSGQIIHSLRLGFFKEAVSAEAVCGYLKTFFGSPSVLRVSVAEHTRFKDAPTPGRPAAAESRAPAKVVELNDARATRPIIPTVTMEVPDPRTDATGSFRMNATGSFRLNAGGSQNVLTPALKPAAKSSGPAIRRSEPVRKSISTGATGKYRAPPKKSLSEQLLDEAREVELSESGIRKLPKNDSLLSRLVGKLTRE